MGPCPRHLESVCLQPTVHQRRPYSAALPKESGDVWEWEIQQLHATGIPAGFQWLLQKTRCKFDRKDSMHKLRSHHKTLLHHL